VKAKGRTKQKQRTRQALVTAALELLKQGKSPTIVEVAQVALVSPATAYRYFANTRSLWLAVLVELGEPSSEDVFAGLEDADAEARTTAMVRVVAWRMFDNEAVWRTAARVLVERPPDGERPSQGERLPVHTGQRLRWIREALLPLEQRLSPAAYRKLSSALALVIGSETVVVLRDVCNLSPAEAKDVSLWAAQTLVRAALNAPEPARTVAGRRGQRRKSAAAVRR
jgi:AcrR family transcriptional regulator